MAQGILEKFQGLAREIAKTRVEFSIRRANYGGDMISDRTRVVMVHLTFARSFKLNVYVSYNLSGNAPRVWIVLEDIFALKRINVTSRRVGRLVSKLTTSTTAAAGGLRKWKSFGSDFPHLTENCKILDGEDWMISPRLVPLVDRLLSQTCYGVVPVPHLLDFVRELRRATRVMRRDALRSELELRMERFERETRRARG